MSFLNPLSKLGFLTNKKIFLVFVLTSLFAFNLGFFGLRAITAEDQVSLYFVPDSVNLPPNSILSMELNAGTESIAFVRATINFDNTKINLSDNIVNTSGLNVIQMTSATSANTTGSATIVFGLNPGDTPPTGIFELIQLPISAISSVQNDNVTIDITTDVQVVNTSAVELEYVTSPANIILNPTEPTLTPTPDLSTTPTISLTPSPTNAPAGTASLVFQGTASTVLGSNYSLDLTFDTNQSVSGVDAVVDFDPEFFQVVDVNEQNLLSSVSQISTDNITGRVRISQLSDVGTGFVGTGNLATVVFESIKSGQTTFDFQYTLGATNDSNAIRHLDGQDILVAPNSFSLVVIEEATLVINLDTPNSTGGDVVEGTVTIGTWTSPFSTDVNGVSSQIILPTDVIGTNATISIDVPGFLRESQNTQIEGDLNIDFGLLRGGDLNDDGIVNNLDLSLMYEDWFSSLDVLSDYNKDGIVNSADHWILTNNFFKEDE